MRPPSIDPLELHAYVDGELTSEQQAELLDALRDDSALAKQACQLQRLKQQLQIAYRDPPPPSRRRHTPRRHWRQRVAILLLLLSSGLTGWLLHPPIYSDRLVLLDADGRGQQPAAADQNETRIVFHLTNPDQLVAAELLTDIEQLLATYRARRSRLRVEVVSHGGGMDLLRQRLSRHQQRIAQLANDYPNLTFVACRNTIDRLRVEQGIELQLIPQAFITESGVSHVVTRQRQGWAYIRV